MPGQFFEIGQAFLFLHFRFNLARATLEAPPHVAVAEKTTRQALPGLRGMATLER
jgi:hypothetical protein